MIIVSAFVYPYEFLDMPCKVDHGFLVYISALDGALIGFLPHPTEEYYSGKAEFATEGYNSGAGGLSIKTKLCQMDFYTLHHLAIHLASMSIDSLKLVPEIWEGSHKI